MAPHGGEIPKRLRGARQVRQAKRLGTFEQSAISTPAGVLRLTRKEVVLRDAGSGLETAIVHFDLDRGVTFDQALEQLRREQAR